MREILIAGIIVSATALGSGLGAGLGWMQKD